MRLSLSMNLESPPIDNNKVESNRNEEDEEIFIVLIVGNHIENLYHDRTR